MRNIRWVVLFITLFSCGHQDPNQDNNRYPQTGRVERVDARLDEIISVDTKASIIAQGFDWSEGPLWVESEQMLLFSDVPKNIIHKWTAEKGTEEYLMPSGYTDTIPRGGEMGSNGLLLDPNGKLVLCQCGNRQMARMDAPLNQPVAHFIPLAQHYQGKKFSSPNDAVYDTKGSLYFTDPPYGLETQRDDDPKKEISWNGVYKVKTNGEVLLLIDSIPRPNGIAFLPGESQIIIACSDPAKPNWYIYDVEGDALTNGRIFYSCTAADRNGVKGLPDGLKVDSKGNVFATGPGGVWIFDSKGTKLGRIHLTEAASNVALSANEQTLFITNDMQILRVPLKERR